MSYSRYLLVLSIILVLFSSCSSIHVKRNGYYQTIRYKQVKQSTRVKVQQQKKKVPYVYHQTSLKSRSIDFPVMSINFGSLLERQQLSLDKGKKNKEQLDDLYNLASDTLLWACNELKAIDMVTGLSSESISRPNRIPNSEEHIQLSRSRQKDKNMLYLLIFLVISIIGFLLIGYGVFGSGLVIGHAVFVIIASVTVISAILALVFLLLVLGDSNRRNNYSKRRRPY